LCLRSAGADIEWIANPRTIQYYDEHAEEIFALYEGAESGPARYFRLAFTPGAEILDIGAGSGRDLGPRAVGFNPLSADRPGMRQRQIQDEDSLPAGPPGGTRPQFHFHLFNGAPAGATGRNWKSLSGR
jgi:hypothetical protein